MSRKNQLITIIIFLTIVSIVIVYIVWSGEKPMPKDGSDIIRINDHSALIIKEDFRNEYEEVDAGSADSVIRKDLPEKLGLSERWILKEHFYHYSKDKEGNYTVLHDEGYTFETEDQSGTLTFLVSDIGRPLRESRRDVMGVELSRINGTVMFIIHIEKITVITEKSGEYYYYLESLGATEEEVIELLRNITS